MHNRFDPCPGSYKQPNTRPDGGACRECGRVFAFDKLAGEVRSVPLHSPDQPVMPSGARMEVQAGVAAPRIDIRLENHGSLYLARPLTDAAKEWINRTAPEDAQFLGNALAIEPRYVSGFCDAAIIDGGLEVA